MRTPGQLVLLLCLVCESGIFQALISLAKGAGVYGWIALFSASVVRASIIGVLGAGVQENPVATTRFMAL